MESVIPLASRRSSTRTLGWISLITVWFLWGSTYLAIRVAVQTMPPLLMAGVRYTIAGLLLSGALLLWKRNLLTQITGAQWKALTIMAFLLLVCGNGALCYAEQYLPSGVAALIVATVPVWMLAIESILSRTAPSPLATAGLALGTLGIIALVGLHFGAIPILPAAIVLFGSFTWALGSVYARYGAHGDNNPLFPAIEMLLGGMMQIVVGIFLGEAAHVHLGSISHESLLGFLWLVGPGAIVGYTAYAYAVRTLPTHVTATYAYVNPVVAVILGATLLGEAITPNIIVGGTVVVLSVVAILMSSTRNRVQPS